MRKLPVVFLALPLALLPSPPIPASPAGNPPGDLLREGIQLYDQGDFEGAESLFLRVLATDPRNPLAHYELALTLLAAERYEECVAMARRGEKLSQNLAGPMIALAGNCLDLDGKGAKAVKLYRQGLRRYGEHYSLRFNLAVALNGQGDSARARENFEETLKLRPNYASAALHLGTLSEEDGLRVPALLAYLRFFTLEPYSRRSSGAAASVYQLLHLGVRRESDQKVTVTVDSSSLKKRRRERLGSVEILLALLSAGRFLEENADKSEAEKTVELLDPFLGAIDAVSERDRPKDRFLWEALMPFFRDLKERRLLEPLGYTMLASIEVDGAQEWLNAQPSAVLELEGWMEANGAWLGR